MTTLMVAGCGAPSDASGQPRHDVDPLVSRFPGIGHPVSATWVIWGNSDRLSAPGPTTYWIDAIIELEPRRAEQLRTTAPNEATPTVHDALRPNLPPGPFLTGPELEAAIVPTAESAADDEDFGWRVVTGYLERTGNRLVLNGLDGT
jgi:hypothetical protein